MDSELEDLIMSRALGVSGVCLDIPDAIEFFRRAKLSLGYLTYKNIRKFEGGAFVKFLNDRGLSDPSDAANNIAQSVEKSFSSARYIQKAIHEEYEHFPRQFRASTMAAGACSAAVELSGVVSPPEPLKLLPLEGCTHPGQCGCLYVPKL